MTGSRCILIARALPVFLSRALAFISVALLVGFLPWLSGNSAEYTVLRARYSELEATPEALARVRAELGLDQGPWAVMWRWLTGVMHGDFGESWISGTPIGPSLFRAFGVSFTLMGVALMVGFVVAALLILPTMAKGLRFTGSRGIGVVATTLSALPSFVLASILLVVVAIWLRWLPPYGWRGIEYSALPALAMGIPAGGYLGKLTADALAGAWSEAWVKTWALGGAPNGQICMAVLRRALSGLMSQFALVIVGLTAGAVTVEQVFAIPGIGRLLLEAASAQDVPVTQAGLLLLLLGAAAVGTLASLARRVALGPALTTGTVPVPRMAGGMGHSAVRMSMIGGALLLVLVLAGVPRDPFATVHPRLAAPSWLLPFGADASGRDLLARVAHGAVSTLGVALLVSIATLLAGILIGLLGRWSTGFVEVANALPSLLVGLVLTALLGPSPLGAAIAVMATAWAPLAAHCADLVAETRGRTYIRLQPLWGVGPFRQLTTAVLPAVLPSVTRHAVLRFPGRALELASLSFLGLGAQPPTPEWGLLVSEGIGYVERAPWGVLAPVLALVLAAVSAVAATQHDGMPRRAP